MTTAVFVTKSAFRNRRRCILTILSIAFSVLLLTLMMTIWNTFYIDQGSAQSVQRLVTRHRVSLTQTLPVFYREKIRAIPGVLAVAPNTWFGGTYKDHKPENFFARFGTDPDEIFKVFPEFRIPSDERQAWQRDRSGVVVDSELAKKHGWKLGDRIALTGTIYPVNLELTVRGIYTADQPTASVYFNEKYVEEAVPWAKDQAGSFEIMADSRGSVARIAESVDAMFRNSVEPTKTESEKAFELSFVNSIGNVKAFILSICLAVVFATILVSANTIAMSIRERTRELAVLRTLGFSRRSLIRLCLEEAGIIALIGGILGCLLASLLISAIVHAPRMGLLLAGMRITPLIAMLALSVAGILGVLSAIFPAYHAAKVSIVEGLRYIG